LSDAGRRTLLYRCRSGKALPDDAPSRHARFDARSLRNECRDNDASSHGRIANGLYARQRLGPRVVHRPQAARRDGHAVTGDLRPRRRLRDTRLDRSAARPVHRLADSAARAAEFGRLTDAGRVAEAGGWADPEVMPLDYLADWPNRLYFFSTSRNRSWGRAMIL